MPIIRLKPFVHQKHNYIAIVFKHERSIYAIVKKIAGVKWSTPHNIFYLPYSRENLNTVFHTLRKYKYYVDYSALNFSESASGKKRNNKREKIILNKTNQIRLEQYRDYLMGLRLSDNTIATYGSFIVLFLYYLKDISLDQVGNDKVRYFVEHLLKEKHYSISSHRQLIGAIKHLGALFSETLIDNPSLVLLPKNNRLPIVLSRRELGSVNTKRKPWIF